jgi:hypothetical protein
MLCQRIEQSSILKGATVVGFLAFVLSITGLLEQLYFFFPLELGIAIVAIGTITLAFSREGRSGQALVAGGLFIAFFLDRLLGHSYKNSLTMPLAIVGLAISMAGAIGFSQKDSRPDNTKAVVTALAPHVLFIIMQTATVFRFGRAIV